MEQSATVIAGFVASECRCEDKLEINPIAGCTTLLMIVVTANTAPVATRSASNVKLGPDGGRCCKRKLDEERGADSRAKLVAIPSQITRYFC